MNSDPGDDEVQPQSMSPFASRRTTIIVLWSVYVIAAIALVVYWIHSV